MIYEDLQKLVTQFQKINDRDLQERINQVADVFEKVDKITADKIRKHGFPKVIYLGVNAQKVRNLFWFIPGIEYRTSNFIAPDEIIFDFSERPFLKGNFKVFDDYLDL